MSDPSIPFPVPRQDLGEFEKAYAMRSDSLARIAAYVVSAMCFAMSVAALWIRENLQPASDTSNIPFLFAVVLAVLSFVCLVAGMLHRVKVNRVALFEEGVALEAEGKVQAMRFDEVLHYYNIGIGQHFRFSSISGEEITISDETAGFGELGAEIRKRAGAEIFDRECARLSSGGESRFGSLVLTQSGIRLDGKSHAWDDVREMRLWVMNGHETLTFEVNAFRGFGPSVAAEKLPSVHVCFRVIEQFAPVRLLRT